MTNWLTDWEIRAQDTRSIFVYFAIRKKKRYQLNETSAPIIFYPTKFYEVLPILNTLFPCGTS